MSLSVGIVGLPNVGKSTLFNALLKKQAALAANYPFATIEPNVGVVPVPDFRLHQLAEVIAQNRVQKDIQGSSKEFFTHLPLPPIVPATVEFYDIAGLVKDAHKGEGLGNQFLSHIRETDAILFVIRAFAEPDVVETGSAILGDDLKTVMTELIMADLETLAKQHQPKGSEGKEAIYRWQVIQKAIGILNQGQWLAGLPWHEDEVKVLKELSLLSIKPALYAVNIGEEQLVAANGTDLAGHFASLISVKPESVVIISAKVEAELADLNPLEQNEYLNTLGLKESGLERLIKAAYQKLGLLSFLTAGEKEVRAWTIKAGSTALEAAGAIHTDFMSHFIKADVIPFDQFVDSGGWKPARISGLVRSEGRDYPVKDGDVIEFKIGR